MRKFFIFLIILVFGVQGCSTISNTIASDKSKKQQLEVLLEKISKSYQWKAYNELAKYLEDPDSNLIRKLSKEYKDFKINEVNIEQVSYENEYERAFTVLEIKSFSSPSYMLKTHYDQVEWKFLPSNGGWKIVKIDLGKAN